MKHWLIGLLLLTGAPAFAQQAVPQIAFDSVPNPLKLPTEHVFRRSLRRRGQFQGPRFRPVARQHRPGPAYAAAATQLLEFEPTASSSARSARTSTPGRSRTPSSVDPHDNIWVDRQGLGHGDQVRSRRAASIMVFGRKQEASDEDTGPLKHPNPPLPADDGRFRQVTDVAWDTAGNTFISDGYINSRVAKVDKNGNWLKSWGDRGNGARPVQHAALRSRPTPRAMSMSPTAAIAAFRCSTATANSCASSPSTCRCRRTRGRRSATCPTRR